MRPPRVGDVLRSDGLLESDRLVDPRYAGGDDRVVFEVSERGISRRVRVEFFREWLDWRIGADL